MKVRTTLYILCCLTGWSLTAQQASLAEQMGYPANSRLLIIHADDLGVSHSENAASIAALGKGPVNSASIMVPCPWFPEIAAYARHHKTADLGLHLTLTSEWKHYKWSPVTSRDSVASLVNSGGYFYSQVDSLTMYGSPEHVEIELRNQVKKAYRAGIDITHLDAHMGAAVGTPEYTAAYLKIGREFKLPVLLDKRIYSIKNEEVQSQLKDRIVVMDQIHSIGPAQFDQGSAAYYRDLFKSLKPGLHCLLIHLAYDDAEMKAMTVDQPAWGAAWPQADYDFFTSPE